ncbi:unnamed protein product [Polarella glacialis]|uniref:Uncharacterized protein n=1 Tax=Polarella glacialis TaxID=89957 RepID=A0A813LXQ4_POLGL|nr:unnamed protein product [Polarella glacialis]
MLMQSYRIGNPVIAKPLQPCDADGARSISSLASAADERSGRAWLWRQRAALHVPLPSRLSVPGLFAERNSRKGLPGPRRSPGGGGDLGHLVPPHSESQSRTEVEALQNRVAAEAAAKDDAKANLESFAHGLEVSMRQLRTACNAADSESHLTSPRAGTEKLLRGVGSFCDDIQEKLKRSRIAPQATGAARTYDVLRQSLTSAQRRCAAMNEDMLRVADGNEELMSSLQVVKDTNRRLVDQIQAQNSEIAELTQLRLEDEAQFEDLLSDLKAEREHQRQELEQRLQTSVADCQAGFREEQTRIAGQLQAVRGSLRTLAAQLTGLRRLHAATAEDVRANLTQWRDDALKQIGRQILDGLVTYQDQGAEQLAQLEDTAHALRARLTAEKEAGSREAEAWSTRGRELEIDGRTLASRASEDSLRVARELSAAEAAREQCRASSVQEQRRFAAQLQELAVGGASLTVILDDIRGQVDSFEVGYRQAQEKLRQLDEEHQAASQRLREEDEALDVAVASNQGLRRQMEAQRVDAQESCEDALKESQAKFEAELEGLLRLQQQEVHGLEAKLQDAEKEFADKASEVVSLELQEDQFAAERLSLERERSLWKAQQELAKKLRQEVDRELLQARKAWEEQLKELREEEVQVASSLQGLQADLNGAWNTTSGFQQESEKKASEAQKRVRSLEAELHEVKSMLGPVRHALQQKVAALSSARGEAGEQRALALESQDELEQNLDSLTQETTDARSRLEADLAVERERLRRARAECEELQRKALASTWGSDSCTAGRLSGDFQDIRDERRKAASRCAQQDAEAERRRADTAETEVKQAQLQLDEQERQLQDEASKLRASRSEVTSVRMRFEVDNVAEGKALADLDLSHREVTSVESRLQAVHVRHEKDVVAANERMRSELDRQRLAMEAAEAENRRLKQLSADSGARGGVEESLSRMRLRTDQLRRELQQRGTPGTPGTLARAALSVERTRR